MYRVLILLSFLGLLIVACTSKEKKILTEEERLWLRVDSIKALAQDGDLITRLNDNIVSHQVRFLNEKDKSYSHAGIIQTINGIKMVTHIDADDPGADTIRYEPVDTFLNPGKNISGGLFRYDLSLAESKTMIADINSYHDQHVHFDRIFDLGDDSAMYCSEMIFKALKKSTNERIVIPTCFLPSTTLKMVYNYTGRKKTIEEIAAQPVITIDNLYRVPACKEIWRFQLKQFPGQ
jgi:hypothetical protein